MKKGKQSGQVIDLFSRKDMEEEVQDTKANDEQTSEMGKYAGHVHEDTAKEIRDNLKGLQSRQVQIDSMILKWENDYQAHARRVLGLVEKLGVKNFDPRKHDVFIGEDGHIWIVDRPTNNKSELH